MIKISKVAKSEFAERIKDLRKQKSLSASAFAKLADVAPASVWQWENNGISPRSETLTAITDTLGVSKDYLLFGRRHDDHVIQSHASSLASAPLLEEAPLEQLIRHRGQGLCGDDSFPGMKRSQQRHAVAIDECRAAELSAANRQQL